jgi:WD40 repeat protein
LNLLAFGDHAASIALWNISNPSAITKKTTKPIPGPIRRIVFNPSENALFLLTDGFEGHYPSVYEWETPLEYNDPRYLFQTSSADNFVAGNRYILVGEFGNGTTSIFNRDISKIPVFRDPKPNSSNVCPFKSTASLPGGSLVAVAACKVQLWDFSDNRVPTMIKELEDSSDPRGVAFSTDGKLLASTHGNNSILIWGRTPNNEYELIQTITSRHTNGVTSVAIGPDGTTMASGGGDQKVILWNISDPEHPTKIAELGLHTGPILNGGMFFLAGGKTLISASKNEIILWDIDPQSWIEKACNIAGRNLTHSEWLQFVGPNIPYHDAACPELPIPPE